MLRKSCIICVLFLAVIVLQTFCAPESSFSTVKSDMTAPVIGSEIIFKDIKANSVNVAWGAGKDDQTAEENLQYKLIYSFDVNEINTVEKAQSSPNVIMDWTENKTETSASNLTSGAKYYFAVIVRDDSDNKSLYETKAVDTSIDFISAVQTGGISGSANSTGLTLTYSADPVSLTAGNITITGAEKGSLSGTGTTRSLAISNISVGNGETISVSVSSPKDCTINKSQQTAVVYRLLNVYLCGIISDSLSSSKAVYWKNGTCFLLPSIDPTTNSRAASIALSGSDVYIGGSNYLADYTKVAVYWKNGSRVDLETINISEIYSIIISEKDVYACGYRHNGTVYEAGYWKNNAWTALPSIDSSKHSYAISILISGSDVYLCGYSINSTDKDVAVYWKNGVLISLSSIDPGQNSQAGSIAVSGSDVYVCGYSRNSGGNNVPGYWKNGTWNALYYPISSNRSTTFSILITGSDIYICGFHLYFAGPLISTAGYWKNGEWKAYNTGNHSLASSIKISGSDIYTCGRIMNEVKVEEGYWKNGTWKPFSIPEGYSVVAFDEQLALDIAIEP